MQPQRLSTGNFGDYSGKIRQGKQVKKMGNVEENEEKWEKEGCKLGKNLKNFKKRRKMKNDCKKLMTLFFFHFSL